MKKVLTEFSIKFNKHSVMDMMDCAPENPLYEETLEEMEALEEKAYSLLETKAVLAYGEIPASAATEYIPAGTKALFAILTVGNGMSIWSANMFDDGDYLGGMLVNAIADDVLFQMDTALKESVIEMSKAVKMGIRKRIEAPNDIGLISQLVAWEATDAKQAIDVNIMSSYMFDPVKTHCQIYLLDEGCTEYKTDHDCRTCSAFHCKRRAVSPVSITVKRKDSSSQILCKENQSIMDALIQNQQFISAVCAGHGVCGKCKIQVLTGNIPVSTADEAFFTEKALGQGYRLSCKAFPKEDCSIAIDAVAEDEFYAVAEYQKAAQNIVQEKMDGQGTENNGIFL